MVPSLKDRETEICPLLYFSNLISYIPRSLRVGVSSHMSTHRDHVNFLLLHTKKRPQKRAQVSPNPCVDLLLWRIHLLLLLFLLREEQWRMERIIEELLTELAESWRRGIMCTVERLLVTDGDGMSRTGYIVKQKFDLEKIMNLGATSWLCMIFNLFKSRACLNCVVT